MAYTSTYKVTNWNPGDPITADSMMNIEEGIASAHRQLETQSSSIGTNQTNIGNVSGRVDGLDNRVGTVETQMENAALGGKQGAEAWRQIQPLVSIASGTIEEGNLLYNETLAKRFVDTEDKASNLLTEVSGARKGKEFLKDKIDAIDESISSMSGSISTINNTFIEASIDDESYNHGSIDARMSADEQRIKTLELDANRNKESTAFGRITSPNSTAYNSLDARLEDSESRIVAMQRELADAHDSTALGRSAASGTAFESIDERFEAIESELVGQTNLGSRLDTLASDINNLTNSKVNKTDIAANLTTESAGKVLDASQGYLLQQNKIDKTSIYNDVDYITDDGKVLDARVGKTLQDAIDALDSTINTADTGLDARLTTAESAINTLESELDADTTGIKARLTTAEGDIDALEDELNTATTGVKARITALETTVDTATTGLTDRVEDLEDTITDSTTGLAAVKVIADAAKATADTALQPADITNLTNRVTTLEGKDTVIVDYDGEHSNYTNNVPNYSNPSVDADYLIADDTGKYFYWRYFGAETGWQLVGGAGGSGNGSSSGVILAALPDVTNGDANTDYFIGTDETGYTHYRFVPGENNAAGHYIRILPNNLINDISVDQYGGLVAHTINDDQTNLLSDFYALKGVTYTPNYDPEDPNTLVSQTLQFTGTNGETIDPIVIVGGGGGGGTVYSVNIESPTPASRSVPSNSTDPVTIQAKVVMKQGNELLGSGATAEGQIQYRQYGTSTWQNGDRIEVSADDQAMRYVILNNTDFTVDVSKYLVDDKTIQIRLAIIAYPGGEGTAVTRYQTFNISKVNIAIVAEPFDYAQVIDSNFQFNYRCLGSGIAKTVHFLIDNEDVVTPVTVPANVLNSTVLQQIIPMNGKTNGMHTFQVYFVTSAGLESNRLNYFILYNTDTERQAPLLGAAAENNSIVDGDEIVVNYSVSTIGSEKTDSVEIELYTMENGTKKVRSTTLLTNVDNNRLASPPYRTFDYPSLKKANPTDPDPDPITVYVKLTATHNDLSDSQTLAIQVRYLNTTYDLQPETNNLLFNYSAYGRSNNDANKDTFVYPYTRVNGEVINFTGTFNNFNWSTDGYVDGESLTIGGGATLNINVPIFNSKFNNVSIEENASIEKITTNGRTIEIDYEVLSTTNLGATIIDCMTTGANPKGFRVTPQNCYLLNSGSNIDIDETGFIKNEENVAAAYLNPGTRTHLTFVIEPISTTLAADNTYHQSANIYINGEFANSCPYNIVGNDFDNNATITIGSDTCLIKLYSIKLYNRGLTEAKVLHNYAVAPVATRDKITRLEDNDILNIQGLVDYEKARKKYTCLLLTGMGTVNGNTVPTMAPYKGYPSVVGRQKDGETVGKTESGLLLTKPTTANSNGYSIEFDLQDKLIDPNNLYGYASSNNVQGTSSQKFPVKNLKVYLAKGDDSNVMVFDENETISVKQVYKYSINTAAAAAYASVHGSEASLPDYIKDCGANIATIVKNLEEVPTQAEVVDKIIEYLNNEDTDVGAAYSTYSTGDELIVHPIKAYKKSKKVKYALRENGIGESTLCWKADYMSTDHANTFNANIANTLYSAEDRLSDRWTDQTQFTVYGIKCLLFQQNGDGQPEFVGDGCLNNDKGNHATFGLETPGDEDDNTMCQKWDFRNNTGSLLYFKHDGLFETIDGKPAIARELECIYPDEGDLADIGITPNYNHFQILSSWLGNRANYWYESNPDKKAAKKQIFINEFTNHFNYNHILIYYLFMEYTALCDNRVKNIHMRTDNAGEERIKIKNSDAYYFEGNENPNSGPWTLAENLETRVMQEPIMDENGDYQFDQNGNMELGDVSHVFVKDSVINSIDWEQGEGHSNFAIWAPVLYDLDSCFSADNVGYLKIRYDADWDYSLYNKLKFAGFDSILWLQVEDCFQDDLKIMAKRLYNRVIGLNYSTFYRQQITDNLASVCPAITNQDMILKYDKPWTEGFLDYSQDVLNPPISTDKYKYLQRGTRTGQKAIFMKQRSLFLASKYDGNEFIQDKITFRAGTQVNHENSVLTLTANQKLYPGAQFGDVNDTTKVTRRASKIYDSTLEEWVDINEEGWVPEFTPCQIQHSGNMNNTDGIEIYGASVLNDIGDISRFHPWQVKVGNAVNLKKLIIGSTTPGYSNTSTDEIDGLNACVLLEEINVCNLKNLTSLQLNNNGFIKKVYATGSGLSTLALPRGGVLDTIAYGANTTDITIINQSRLTNFSYEDSANNNYANVTRLWIENTPNVPIIDIVTARLTATTSEDAGLRVGGLRLVGLNLNLGADTSFLQLLASDLVKGTRLTAAGGHVTDTDETPYISGTITVNKIRASLYATLHELYPDLIINANEVTQEFEVTYLNYNGDLLYTAYGTNEDDIIDPVYDSNPITQAPYIPMPTKPEDAQYKYRFGQYDRNNKYRKFTGWIKRGTTTSPVSGEKINGDLTLIAIYPTTEDQYYTVTWYQDSSKTQVVGTPRSVKYGTDMSSENSPVENGNMPRIRLGGNTVKIFKGWSTPLGKITSNISVYGLWEESGINDATEEIHMDTLSAADIYALSRLTSDRKAALLTENLGSCITIPMGQELDYPEGVQITNLLGSEERLILSGTDDDVRIYNDIKPLATNSDWTFAIDYKFLVSNPAAFRANEYVLASCYENANSSIIGFKVSLVQDPNSTATNQSPSIQVSWGTSTKIIDYANRVTSPAEFNAYRNVVVLRHNSDEPNILNVSYRVPNTSQSSAPGGSNYSTTLVDEQLDYANYITNAPLIIGGNYANASTSIENTTGRTRAEGIVYWAKFWNANLGELNCLNLAAWPHEKVEFYLTGYNGASVKETGETLRETEQLYNNSMLSFAAAQGVGDRYFWPVTTGGVVDENQNFGWHQTSMRTICNDLIYRGLPETYRAIISTSAVPFLYKSYSGGTAGGTGNDTAQDYFFLSARCELDENRSSLILHELNEIETDWMGPFAWFAQPRIIYTLTSGSSTTVAATTSAANNYYLYRFAGITMSEDARIFRTAARPNTINNFSIRNNGQNDPVTFVTGDVWVDDSTGIAYIYLSEEDIENGETVDIRDTNGGWRQAVEWALRTYNPSSTSPQEWAFMRVSNAGVIINNPVSGSSRNTPRLLCPEFTV